MEGTSTATVDVAGMIEGGDTVATVCDEYGLTRHQVLLACWHQAISDRWDCWRAWAFEVHPVLSSGSPAEVDALPDPPARVEASPMSDTVTTPADGEHVYLSTACLHGQHEHCRSNVAADGGTKTPGTCKFCGAVCVCPVCDHTAAAQT